ncbi:TPA: hypothetical protein I2U04_12110 [Staphylococcus aureus]|nr:hypothetical protein [Staphylococcus aureus]HAR7306842.1 hypothetical protein [Staphylococcus aureus]
MITCVYSRSELYSPAEAIYLTVGPTGDIFLVITRYIYFNNIEILQSLHHSLHGWLFLFAIMFCLDKIKIVL